MEITIFINMREESCRTCGKDMKEFQRCPICSKIIRFTCRQCGKSNEEQIHVDCILIAKKIILN